MNQDIIDSLIAKSVTKALSDSEKAELDGYLATSDDVESQHEQAKLIWFRSNGLSQFEKVNSCAENDYCKVMARLNIGKGSLAKNKTVSILYKWMAAASVLFVLSIGSWYLFNNVAGFGKWQSVVTKDTLKTVTLPDGSIVNLNANSELLYFANDNSKTREVRLKGEAYFDVKSNKERPFVVNLDEGFVQVLGTSFNVKTNKELEQIEVFVQHGKVALGFEDEKIYLTDSELGRLNNGLLSKNYIKDETPLVWKQSQISLVNCSLSDAVNILKYHFPEISSVDILKSDNKTLVTSQFKGQSLQSILTELEMHFDASFKFEKTVLVVK